MKIFLLTRGYPHPDRIYNHGFVHPRVKAYQALGHEVMVWWNFHRGPIERYEWDGVTVTKGDPASCLEQMRSFAPDAVAAHAPADDFWPVLSQVPSSIPINGWIYGAEIMAFHKVTQRRDDDPALYDRVHATYERRIDYWRTMAKDWPENYRLVFVSQFAAQDAFQNVGQELPRWTVLPSPVDTSLFQYHPKVADDRYRVLTLRPFSDWRYANDLGVSAIQALQQRADFSKFQFRFIGDGRLMDDILAPIAGLPNVRIEKGFIAHHLVVAAHRAAGVLLSPTRNDAQGVARDEAMASGLVPVSNHVGAVPEFVDDRSGFLAPAESAAGLADAMAAMADDADLFLAKSAAAAERIRDTIAMDRIIPRELELLRG